VDSQSLVASTATNIFMVSELSARRIVYDDSSSEVFNWSPDSGFAWAVKFTPPETPFVLSEAEIAVAAFHPDTAHTPVIVKVYDANGNGGLPGTLLGTYPKGSVGNVIGGLSGEGAHWITAILFDPVTEPLILNADFYVSVENTGHEYEAFATDTSSLRSGRSYYFSPCDQSWHNELESDSLSQPGNRMIRARGWVDQPTELVIRSDGSDVLLSWASTGAAYYRLFKALLSEATVWDSLGSTSDTSFVVSGVIPLEPKVFYRVVSSTAP
jgi:hypothetical protein